MRSTRDTGLPLREGNKISSHVFSIKSRFVRLFQTNGIFLQIPNSESMENYIKKAAEAFLVERPYGMRVDYRKKGYVLFNRNLNVLGNAECGCLEELPLEQFAVEDIPLEGEMVEEHTGFTDVFFYSDYSNPYAGHILDLKKLKVYNQYIYPLATVLDRIL